MDAWDARWIVQDVRIAGINIHILMQLKSARVMDLMREDGEWNWDILCQWLPENIMRKIVSILPPSTEAGPDVGVGIRGSCKSFYVSAMYKLVDDEDTSRKMTDRQKFAKFKPLKGYKVLYGCLIRMAFSPTARK